MNAKAAKHLQAARMTAIEFALLEFVEGILGRTPTDDEILKLGVHARFADSPLSVYEKDGYRFVDFYVWGNEYALGHGFFMPKEPLTISVVQIPPEWWPTALKLFVAKQKESDA